MPDGEPQAALMDSSRRRPARAGGVFQLIAHENPSAGGGRWRRISSMELQLP